MQNDHLSDMLTRIRNANILHKKTVDVTWTRLNEQILSVFEKEGFILSSEKNSRKITVYLKYDKKTNKPCILNLQSISKPGLRLYSKAKDIPQILGGMGVLVLSTSQGILTDQQAKQKRVGGQLLCSIW